MTSLASSRLVTRSALAALAGFGVAGVLAASPASAVPVHAFSPQSPQGRALLASGAPKTIQVDPATGEYVKVVAGLPPLDVRHNAVALQNWIDARAAQQ